MAVFSSRPSRTSRANLARAVARGRASDRRRVAADPQNLVTTLDIAIPLVKKKTLTGERVTVAPESPVVRAATPPLDRRMADEPATPGPDFRAAIGRDTMPRIGGLCSRVIPEALTWRPGPTAP